MVDKPDETPPSHGQMVQLEQAETWFVQHAVDSDQVVERRRQLQE